MDLSSGRGRTRTGTRVTPQGILSPQCLPFHHAAEMLLGQTHGLASTRKPYQLSGLRQPPAAIGSRANARSGWKCTPSQMRSPEASPSPTVAAERVVGLDVARTCHPGHGCGPLLLRHGGRPGRPWLAQCRVGLSRRPGRGHFRRPRRRRRDPDVSTGSPECGDPPGYRPGSASPHPPWRPSSRPRIHQLASLAQETFSASTAYRSRWPLC